MTILDLGFKGLLLNRETQTYTGTCSYTHTQTHAYGANHTACRQQDPCCFQTVSPLRVRKSFRILNSVSWIKITEFAKLNIYDHLNMRLFHVCTNDTLDRQCSGAFRVLAMSIRLSISPFVPRHLVAGR